MPPRFGNRKQGPDLSWEDADVPDPNDPSGHASSPPSNVPGPLFPPRTNIRTPRPLDADERAAVSAQLRFRDSCRNGPLFAVLDQTLTPGADGKMNKQAGFDPFDGQERYSTRHLKKRQRTEPDLSKSGRGDYGYTLRLFPQELWGVLDPKQTLPDWKDVGPDSMAMASLGKRAVRRKRKVRTEADFDRDMLVNGAADEGAGDSAGEEDDEDPIRGSGRDKRRRKEQRQLQRGLTDKSAGQRKGMDAEDEFEAYPLENADDEDADDDSLVDSEFSESEGDAPDYQAEGYFDGGDDDYDDGGGGGDDGGGDY